MVDLWYYQKGQEDFGPVPLEALKTLIQSGLVSSNDQIRREGSNWKPIDTFSELFTEVSKLSGQSVSVAYDDILSSASSYSGNGNSATKEDFSRTSECSGSQALGYCIRLEGIEIGPLSLQAIQDHINNGRLKKYDRIRKATTRAWIPCSEIEGLSFPSLAEKQTRPLPQSKSASQKITAKQVEDVFSELLIEKVLSESETPEHYPHKYDTVNESRTSVPETQSTTKSIHSHQSLLESSSTIESTSPYSSSGHPVSNPKPRLFSGFQLNTSLTLSVLVGAMCLIGIASWRPNSGIAVEGKVKVDGKSIPSGSIIFIDEKSGKPLEFSITNGHFEGSSEEQLEPNEYFILITIDEQSGNSPPIVDYSPFFDELNGAIFEGFVKVHDWQEITVEISANEIQRLGTVIKGN